MKQTRLSLSIFLVAVIAAAALIASTASGKAKAQPAVAAGSAISLKQTSLGKVLVDAGGRTLYLFLGDKHNLSRLSPAGRTVWPLFVSGTRPRATRGVIAARIGTAIGTRQITYNGHPLYYYIGDRKPGQTLGQGLNEFGARWYALAASGAAITSAPKSAAPAASTAPAYGLNYGY
jgi:predicted lipoprotein with Yx(FWY)xxD motif